MNLNADNSWQEEEENAEWSDLIPLWNAISNNNVLEYFDLCSTVLRRWTGGIHPAKKNKKKLQLASTTIRADSLITFFLEKDNVADNFSLK